MGYLTKYGTLWGIEPTLTGQIFFVSPSDSYTIEGRTYSASNDNDGLSPERAFRTLAYAVLSTRSNPATAGDVIFLLPGNHTSTSTVTVSTAGLKIFGIPGSLPHYRTRRNSGSKKVRSTITNTGTAGVILTINANDVEVAYLHFLPTAAGGQAISLTNTTANRTYIRDCTFALEATASVTTYGITTPAGVTADVNDDIMIANCYFRSGKTGASGANGPAVYLPATMHGFTIENSTFELMGTAAWAKAINSVSAGTLGLVVRDCDAINPTSATTVITTFLDTTGQTVDGSTQVYRCYIPTGTDGVTASAMVDIVLCETYLANSSGGTLVTNA
jgi:hypothetical protein